jgi:hypothetical protein
MPRGFKTFDKSWIQKTRTSARDPGFNTRWKKISQDQSFNSLDEPFVAVESFVGGLLVDLLQTVFQE